MDLVNVVNMRNGIIGNRPQSECKLSPICEYNDSELQQNDEVEEQQHIIRESTRQIPCHPYPAGFSIQEG